MGKKIVEVDIWDIGQARFPDADMLYTEALGPCMAVAVYDPGTRSGYLLKGREYCAAR